MFRLIGIIVVIAVCIIAYSSIEKWYEGRATPSETVVNIRDQVGTALKPSQNHNSESLGDESNQKSNIQTTEAQEKPSHGSSNTEDAARELIKHAND